MAEEISPFLTESFQSALQKCCAHANWPIARIEEGIVVLKLTDVNPDNPQIVYIEDIPADVELPLENHIKFSLGTIFEFTDGVAPPYELLKQLMQENDNKDIGHWCLEYSRGKSWISLRHFEHKKDMTLKRFQKQVLYLMIRCDLVESELADA